MLMTLKNQLAHRRHSILPNRKESTPHPTTSRSQLELIPISAADEPQGFLYQL